MAWCESLFNITDFNEAWGDEKRKDIVFLARTAEAAERYDDMVSCMTLLVSECATAKQDLSVDERNLLSVAYKNVIGSRRASWRTLNAEGQDEKSEDVNAGSIKIYQKQVELELKDICNAVLSLLKDNLIDNEKIQAVHDQAANLVDKDNLVDNLQADFAEAQVFYLKMAGDYCRYLAEAVQDPEHEQDSAKYYKQAFELSQVVLEPTHPIRLGLALNYSVCFYEILKDKKKACQLAKDAFDEAISRLDKLEESDYKDSTLIMQLLRDNLTLWTSTDEPDNEFADGQNEDAGD